MKAKLLASSAIAALLMTSAFAQDTTTQPAPQAQPEAQAQPAQPVETAAPMQAGDVQVTRFLGMSVYSSNAEDAEQVGEIDDLVLGEDGSISAAVIGVGGFLGIGEKDVAIPFKDLQIIEGQGDDIRLVLNATKEQLEAAESFQRRDDMRFARGAGGAGGVAAPAATDTAATAPAETGAGMAAAPAPAAPAATTTDTAASTTAPAAGAETTAAATPPANVEFMSAPANDQMLASNWLDKDVVNGQNQAVGDVEDILLDDSGKIRALVVDLDEATGFGDRNVEIPMDQVSVQIAQPAAAQPADQTATTGQAAPADQAATDGQAAPAGQTATTGQATPADQTATSGQAAPADQTAAAGQAAPTAGAAQPAGQQGEAMLVTALTNEQLQALPQHMRPEDQAAATAPAAGTTAPGGTTDATGMAAVPAAPLTTDAATGTATAPAAPAGGTATATAPTQDGAAAPADTAMAPAAGGAQGGQMAKVVSADELIGSRVYGADESDLGEINDLVFANDGSIQGVIVDVGGFLGIGEKPVALSYDALNVSADKDGAFRVSVPATEDQLKAAPAFGRAQ